MVNRNLLRQFDLSEEDLEQQLAEAMGLDSYDPAHPVVTFGAEEEFEYTSTTTAETVAS